MVIEHHFSAARTGAGSGASPISKKERIGIVLSSREAMILSYIFLAEELPYVPLTDATFSFGPSSSVVIVSAKASTRNGILRNAQPELATANSSAGSSEISTARIWGYRDSSRATTSLAFP